MKLSGREVIRGRRKRLLSEPALPTANSDELAVLMLRGYARIRRLPMMTG